MVMDPEDETGAYLKLFSDGPHNYFLHSNEDDLTDGFPVESIYTDWSAESFPIFLSGSRTSEDATLVEADGDEDVQLFNGNNKNSSDDLTNKSVAFFSDDLLLRVEDVNEANCHEGAVAHVINGNTYSITYEQGPEIAESANNVEVLHLVNSDGTVTAINENLLNNTNATPESSVCDKFYTQIRANKCKLCGFLCETVDQITDHLLLIHADEVVGAPARQKNDDGLVGTKMKSILNGNKEKDKYILYLCSTCGSGYSDREDLKQHMIKQHKMVERKGPPVLQPNAHDPKPTSTQKKTLKSAMVDFFKKQKYFRVYKCSIKGCPHRFTMEHLRKKHEDCHVNGQKRLFKCLECSQKFSVWRICSMHLWRHHKIDLGLLTCPVCNKFKSNSSLRVITHMAIHSDEKPFLCGSCGMAFKQLNQLRNHEVHHKAENENCDTRTKCKHCDGIFANAKCLKKHVAFVHEKFKPFICNICGHQTSRKDMLQLHYRQHTGDKPYHCSYCEYKTGDKNCLRRHTMRHFGTAKYFCPYCDYRCIQASSYKTHLANKHPKEEGAFVCKACSYTTINNRSYVLHLKYHEIEEKKTKGKVDKIVDDSESKSSDETHNFLNTEHSEEPVDNGGITIPATFDLQLDSASAIT